MIYTVDIRFLDAVAEPDWNAWYSAHLTEMVRIPGLDTAQRFVCDSAGIRSYLAVYCIAAATVFDSEPYRRIAGAGPRSIWRDSIVRQRNLYAGFDIFPEVTANSRLGVSDLAPAMLDHPDIQWLGASAAGLDRSSRQRSFCIVDAAPPAIAGAQFFRPITDRYATRIPSDHKVPSG